jgi:hypothetical protein
MRALAPIVLCLTAILPATGFHQPVDLEKERAELLKIHEEMLQAHLNRDVEWFVRDMAEEQISVQDGEVQMTTPAETRRMFSDYLGRTRFSEYRDLKPPIVHVSKDGTLASVIVQVSVSGRQRNDEGAEEPLRIVASWLTLYEKRAGKWIRVAIVSTRKR